MTRFYLGLAASPHDPAIAMVNGQGTLVFAEALERPLQNKRAWHTPPNQMPQLDALLKHWAGNATDIVASLTWPRGTRAQTFALELLLRGLRGTPLASSAPWSKLFRDSVLQVSNALRASLSQTGLGLETHLQPSLSGRFRLERRAYDHRLSQAAAAAYSSPFRDAACIVVDGPGRLRGASVYAYRDGTLREVRSARSALGANLGTYYAAVCEACGFDWQAGEEWKVMGLSPYGTLDPRLYALLRPMIQLRGPRAVPAPDYAKRERELLSMRPAEGRPAIEMADLAYTGQRVFCEIYLELIRRVHALDLSENLVLTGSCALNSAANGQVLNATPFTRLFVPCAPADDGAAVGAAWLAFYEDHPERWRPSELATPYLGSELRREALDRLAQYGGLEVSRLPDAELFEHVAARLAAGHFVGWIQGRAEFGPRALGNRSILADPRRPGAQDAINERVKFREEFRPFAPSVLQEDAATYFEQYQESPYMERTLKFTELGCRAVPGVVHVDKTGRLQTVVRKLNPRFHALISAFKRQTGVPLLLNTSFNVMGKPIVHAVEDAVAVLMTSGLDTLVIDDLVFEKPAARKPKAVQKPHVVESPGRREG